MTSTKTQIGPWRVNSAKGVFENPWIKIVDHDVCHPDGSPGQYGVVRFKNRAIGILPIDENGETFLIGQHRFPLDRYSWELPEGGGPLSDAPLSSAKRELKEETGFTAADWLEISSFDISNSVTDEEAVCFLAWNLTPGPASPDGSEDLALEKISFARLHDRVLEGDIRDSLTIIMVLTAYNLAKRGNLPEIVSERILRTR